MLVSVVNGVARRVTVASLLVLLCSVVALPAAVHAQSAANSGQIGGQVLDPSGAVVADVPVQVRNVDTNYTRSTTTDSSGRYAVGPVPLGTYEVTATPANMAPSTRTVYVSLGARAAADFDLGLVGVRESVDVMAATCPRRVVSISVRGRGGAAAGRRLVDT